MGKCGSARQMNANERLSGATEVEVACEQTNPLL